MAITWRTRLSRPKVCTPRWRQHLRANLSGKLLPRRLKQQRPEQLLLPPRKSQNDDSIDSCSSAPEALRFGGISGGGWPSRFYLSDGIASHGRGCHLPRFIRVLRGIIKRLRYGREYSPRRLWRFRLFHCV